jgi:anti-anti-sigma factor
MAAPVTVPKDFRGVVVTLPANMGAGGVTQLQQLVAQARLDRFAGHRVLHLHQVAHLDSSAIAVLVGLVERVRKEGYEVALCEAPPVVRSYLDIYGANHLLDGAILSSDNDGMYESALVPFVPPFVPEPRGRIDRYENGSVQSWLFGNDELIETPSPDLAKHPPKAIARAQVMAIHAGEQLKELQAGAFVWVRRHMCGCSHTHTTFEGIHKLHDWYRRKAFDFVSLELWASDQPAGIVTEKLAFRDRAHHGQFETLLKIDTSWQGVASNGHAHEDEFYYLYA